MNYYLFIFCMTAHVYLDSSENQPEQKSFFSTQSHLAMLGVVIGSCIQSSPKFFSQLTATLFQNQSLSKHSQTFSLVAGGLTLISGLYLWRSNSLWQRENISLNSQNAIKEKKFLDLTKQLSQKSKNIDELQESLKKALEEKSLSTKQISLISPGYNSDDDTGVSAIKAYAHFPDK